MLRYPKTVLVDTGFWIAFYDRRDNHHAQAHLKEHYLKSMNILVPWPSLYETFNTRFAKNRIAVRSFDALLRQTHVERLDDVPYREKAFDEAVGTALIGSRSISLVDMVIRQILDDINVHKDGLLTFDLEGFSDICSKHRIEIL